MPVQDRTIDDCLDVVAAATRELSASHAVLEARVPGDEAARVAMIVKFEADRLAEILPVLRQLIKAPDALPVESSVGKTRQVN